MKVKIIQVGKTKDAWVQAGLAEFEKRLSHCVQLEVVTLKECAPAATVTLDQCKEAEADEILKAIDDDHYLVVLSEEGKEMSSMDFAGFWGDSKDEGRSICFVIGGPFGLSKRVKDRANLLMSFSKMTFTHQMIRLFLMEQMYRGCCILTGKEYHH